jgi:hypothetical protein
MSKSAKKVGTAAIAKKDVNKEEIKKVGSGLSLMQGSNLTSVPTSKAKIASAQPQARFSLMDVLASVSGTGGYGGH